MDIRNPEGVNLQPLYRAHPTLNFEGSIRPTRDGWALTLWTVERGIVKDTFKAAGPFRIKLIEQAIAHFENKSLPANQRRMIPPYRGVRPMAEPVKIGDGTSPVPPKPVKIGDSMSLVKPKPTK
jgi:hypothetical protein